MSVSYSLFKNKLRKSIIDSIYSEIVTKTSRYYHWFGKENTWTDFLSPFIPSSPVDIPGPPQNNYRYDLHVRRDFITLKSISSSDVSYVVPRYDWKYNSVYDMYDDAYTTPIAQAITWQPGLAVRTNDIVKYLKYYYTVGNNGNLGTSGPLNTIGSAVNGNVTLTYLTRDEIAYSGATSLETAKFYVLTTDYNVYKCIWNNYDRPSTVMPTGTPTDVFTTADGYKWKFMYTIPISLRNRFLSTDYIPVTTALKNDFYTNGALSTIVIDSTGANYLAAMTGSGTITTTTSSATVTGTGTSFTTQAKVGYKIKKTDGTLVGTIQSIGSATSITLTANAAVALTGQAFIIAPPITAYATVTGDGFIEENPYSLTSLILTNPGSGYPFNATAALTFSAPTVTIGAEATATASLTYRTSTFDGSNATVVNVTNNTVTSTAHGFLTGDNAYYSANGGTALGGLTSGNNYYIIRVDANTYKFATTYANALAGTAVDITAVGTGTTHKVSTQAVPSTTTNRTITFNPTNAVNTSTEVITYSGHKFNNGDAVVYSNGGGSSIGGLTSGSTYYVIYLTASTFKLATTFANATATTPVAINLTSVGAGQTHTFTQSIGAITISSAGYGYAGAPTVDVAEPYSTYVNYGSGTTVTLGQIVKTTKNQGSYNQDIYYKVTTAGQLGTTAPTHETDSASSGTTVLQFVAKRAVVTPVVTKTEASITLNIVGGAITSTTIDQAGIGYTNANITVYDGTGYVDWTASTSVSFGTTIRYVENAGNTTEVVYYYIVTTAGTTSATTPPTHTTGTVANGTAQLAYLTSHTKSQLAQLTPTFSFGNVDTLQANVELLAVPGAIHTIKVVDQGANYGAATVTIDGDGTGCTATAVIDAGKIVGINVTNIGYGYTWTNVNIIGDGTGAVARAIMSPVNGHGFDAVDELNANSLMFYSSISRDLNQGLEINNDYRKVGLVKNINEFGSNTKFTGAIGSGCVLIEGTFDKTKLAYDMLLTQFPDTYKNYRVVEFNEKQILVSVFNNFPISVGDTLKTEGGYNIIVSKVTERTIDQFSGDLLLINVREPYAPTQEQIVTVRTVITI